MWYYDSDNNGIAISSRVRIARNLEEYKFPHMLDENKCREIANKVKESISDEYDFFSMKDIDEITKMSLVEKHIISKEFIQNVDKGYIILNKENDLSIMINEEDHLRIQGFACGNNISKAYSIAKKAEKEIGKNNKYAISSIYGYLTSCPTNVGSGIRVSVMLHLPALSELGYMDKLFEEASSIGIAIRGIYGENTNAIGNIYQISNQRTMGLTDEEIISNVKEVVTSIISKEKKLRSSLKKENSIVLEDKIYRSLGLLKSARILSSNEAEKLLSDVRTGVEIGYEGIPNLECIQKIQVNIKPNTLQLVTKEKMNENERDIERANYIRKELN